MYKMNSITNEQALRLAGITDKNLLQMEREWLAKFKAALPIPRNARGHRQLSPAWAYWLKHAWALRKRGAEWLEIKMELAQVQPREAVAGGPPKADPYIEY
jgi:hypothetical protein